MSFFVTSAGSGKGADLGGIAGADRICQTLATAAGSTQDVARVPEPAGRERSGGGQRARPDRRRAVVQREGRAHRAERRRPARRHAREGAARQQHQQDDGARPRRATTINGVGDTPNQHDMITGSQLDGTAFTDGADHTCGNYTQQRDDRQRAARPPRSHRRRQHLVELDAPEPRLQPGEPGRDRRRRAVLLLRDQLGDGGFTADPRKTGNGG